MIDAANYWTALALENTTVASNKPVVQPTQEVQDFETFAKSQALNAASADTLIKETTPWIDKVDVCNLLTFYISKCELVEGEFGQNYRFHIWTNGMVASKYFDLPVSADENRAGIYAHFQDAPNKWLGPFSLECVPLSSGRSFYSFHSAMAELATLVDESPL